MQKTFQVKLKRSLIGTTQRQRDAVRCLGLKRINDIVTVKDSPAMRGQIHNVQHLLEVKVGSN
ncbi:MAG: 50S ribosomal protein L30 [Bdellovibrionales bacterium]|nr:50S ribosomal protein L30 [Bdellovibrionales bacterium]